MSSLLTKKCGNNKAVYTESFICFQWDNLMADIYILKEISLSKLPIDYQLI